MFFSSFLLKEMFPHILCSETGTSMEFEYEQVCDICDKFPEQVFSDFKVLLRNLRKLMGPDRFITCHTFLQKTHFASVSSVQHSFNPLLPTHGFTQEVHTQQRNYWVKARRKYYGAEVPGKKSASKSFLKILLSTRIRLRTRRPFGIVVPRPSPCA